MPNLNITPPVADVAPYQHKIHDAFESIHIIGLTKGIAPGFRLHTQGK